MLVDAIEKIEETTSPDASFEFVVQNGRHVDALTFLGAKLVEQRRLQRYRDFASGHCRYPTTVAFHQATRNSVFGYTIVDDHDAQHAAGRLRVAYVTPPAHVAKPHYGPAWRGRTHFVDGVVVFVSLGRLGGDLEVQIGTKVAEFDIVYQTAEIDGVPYPKAKFDAAHLRGKRVRVIYVSTLSAGAPENDLLDLRTHDAP